MSADIPHHAFDRSLRDEFRNAVIDMVEGVFGLKVAPDARALQTHIERGPLEVDGLVLDDHGQVIHVEFQTRADRELGTRMLSYYAALDRLNQPPQQHVLLLAPGADYTGIGEYRRPNLELRYHVHRLWEIDPELLLSRPGLYRLAPLARAATIEERIELLTRAARAIQSYFQPDEAKHNLEWMGHLSNLYLPPQVISEILEAIHVPIDLSETELIKQALAEGEARGRAEGEARGRASTQRGDIRRIVRLRFNDETLADRAASVPASLLEPTFDRAAAANDAADITAWLEANHA